MVAAFTSECLAGFRTLLGRALAPANDSYCASATTRCDISLCDKLRGVTGCTKSVCAASCLKPSPQSRAPLYCIYIYICHKDVVPSVPSSGESWAKNGGLGTIGTPCSLYPALVTFRIVYLAYLAIATFEAKLIHQAAVRGKTPDKRIKELVTDHLHVRSVLFVYPRLRGET
jgi:hypothetical protein